MEHELSVIRQHVNDLRVAHMELSQMDPSVHTTASVLVDDMGRCVRDLSEAAKCIRTAEGTLHRLRGTATQSRQATAETRRLLEEMSATVTQAAEDSRIAVSHGEDLRRLTDTVTRTAKQHDDVMRRLE